MATSRETSRSKRKEPKRHSDELKMLEELEEDQLAASPFSAPSKKRRKAVPIVSESSSDVEFLGSMPGTGGLKETTSAGSGNSSMASASNTAAVPVSSTNNLYEDEHLGDDAVLSEWELDVLIKDERQDDEAHDTIIMVPEHDDNDYVADNVEEEDLAPRPAAPAMDVDDECVEKFQTRLRTIIEEMKAYTKKPGFKNLPRKDRPMTFGFWVLLSRVSVDFLLHRYLEGISLEVQSILGQQTFSPADFLSLPDTWREETSRVGIYGDCAVRQTNDSLVYDQYIGSANASLASRMVKHDRISRRSFDSLSRDDKKVKHYRYISQPDVTANLRVLAAFHPGDLSSGYVLLLEAIMVIVYDTYQDPGTYHNWSNKATYDFAREIRITAELPPVEWEWNGLNNALPLFQGYSYEPTQTLSKCRNPACTRMTYPNASLPDGELPRRDGVEGDPLSGGYLCGHCASYQKRNRAAPSVEIVRRRDEFDAVRQQAGDDPECSCCKKLESQGTRRPYRATPGLMVGFMPHRVHSLLPGQLLCNICWAFTDVHRKLPTTHEVDLRAAELAMRAARRNGPAVCEQCARVEGSGNRRNGNHMWNGIARKILCLSCDSFLRNQSTASTQRTPQHEARLVDRKAVDELRKQGLPVRCHKCNAVEPAIPAGSKKRKWRNQLQGPICHSCRLKEYREKKLPKT